MIVVEPENGGDMDSLSTLLQRVIDLGVDRSFPDMWRYLPEVQNPWFLLQRRDELPVGALGVTRISYRDMLFTNVSVAFTGQEIVPLVGTLEPGKVAIKPLTIINLAGLKVWRGFGARKRDEELLLFEDRATERVVLTIDLGLRPHRWALVRQLSKSVKPDGSTPIAAVFDLLLAMTSHALA